MVIGSSDDTTATYSFWTSVPTKIKIVNYIDLIDDHEGPAAYFAETIFSEPQGYSNRFDTYFAIHIAPQRLPDKMLVTELKIIPENTKVYKSITKVLQWSLG